MTSPTKEGSDSVDESLKNSENEAPNTKDVEPSFTNPDIIPQGDNDTMNRNQNVPNVQENTAAQAAKDSDLEAEKTQKDPQKEDLRKEEPPLVQIPIPRKWVFLMPGFGRITDFSIPIGKNDRNNTLIDGARFFPGKVEMKTNDLSHGFINYKIPLQLSVSWRVPFISNHEMRRMILRLLCGRHFSQIAGRQNATWVKQKFRAFLPRPNFLTHGDRAIIFGRPLRVYYNRPLLDRMASGKFYKPTDTKGKDGFHIFVRPVFCVPWAQIQNSFNGKAFEDHLRSHHNMRIIIISTNTGWKYICPICGNSFNSLFEFREHSCSFPRD
ncbi:CPX chromosomal region candidate gene 1 protein [Erinaceus europaeus]|uniref:CPX chromosomal region candidate gene 1 protein n=1 Tax=Erinaceus europaeus TaxID=9365 RepID=A0A1S3ANX4_ERIEU|nr:CPX chromosomal region candidate gene 1 protein [Erinaceus europaeus]